MSLSLSLTESTAPTGKSTGVSMIAWAWFFSATADLEAAFFDALAVLAADFLASVVARLAWAFDLVLLLLLSAAMSLTYSSVSVEWLGRRPSLANICLSRTDVPNRFRGGGYTQK